MKIKIVVFTILITIIGCSSVKQNSITQKTTFEDQISCSLKLNKDSFKIGDELRLFFVIENLTNEPIFTSNSPYNSYYIDGKRSEDGYDIRIKTENETELKQTIPIDVKSGRYGITKIDPKEQMEIRIHDIFKYEITANEGIYSLELDKRFYVYLNKKVHKKYYENNPSDFKTKELIIKTEKINIEVNKAEKK